MKKTARRAFSARSLESRVVALEKRLAELKRQCAKNEEGLHARYERAWFDAWEEMDHK